MASTRFINETIHTQMEDWINTLPDPMRNRVRDAVIVTGGCIVSMLRNEQVNDFDIYFSDPGVAKEVIQHYVDGQGKDLRGTTISVDGDAPLYRVFVDASGSSLNRIGHDVGKSDRSTLISFKKNNKFEGRPGVYIPLFLTENALTLTNGIQLVTRFSGHPSALVGSFDYVHPTSYWTYSLGLKLLPDAMESILTNELKVNNVSRYPVAALMRMRKFIERGWKINAGSMFKIAFAISKLDLSDVRVLRNQLIGVDLLLFVDFLRELEQIKGEDGRVDDTMIMQYIDDIFDGYDGALKTKTVTTSDLAVETANPVSVKKIYRRATY